MPRDHIREFYEAGGYIKPRGKDRTKAALSRVRFDAGGPTMAMANPLKLVKWTERMWDKLPDLQKKALQKVGLHGMATGNEGLIYGRDTTADVSGVASRMIKGDEGSVKLTPGYRKFMGAQPTFGEGDRWAVHSHPGRNSTAMPSGIPGDTAVWLTPHANRMMPFPGGSEMGIIAPHTDQLLKMDPVDRLWTGPGARLTGPRQRLDRGFLEEINPTRYLRNDDMLGTGHQGQTEAIQEWAKVHGVGLPDPTPTVQGDKMSSQFWPVYQSLSGGRWMDRLGDFGVGFELPAEQKIPNTNVLTKDALESYVPFAKGRFGFADGGPTLAAINPAKAGKAFDYLRKFTDPAADLIKDWAWRPLQDVARDLKITGPSSFSPEVMNYADFMRKMSNTAGSEGLSPEDLMKSYAITRSSMGRKARSAESIINAGLDVPPGEMIRPEGAMALWLRTPEGKQYLEEAAHTGKVDPKISAALSRVMTPFGKQNEFPQILEWGAQNLPGREARASELVSRASQGGSDPAEWLDLMGDTYGIKPSKQGFFASGLGRGDMPTFDARQIILNTGLPSAEGSARVARPDKAVEAVKRLRARMEGLDYQGPEWMKPYYPHLAHHETWDRSAGAQTAHQDIIDTMLDRAEGGRVGYSWRGLVRGGEKLLGAGERAADQFGRMAYDLMPERKLIEQIAEQTGHSVGKIVDLVRDKTKGVRGDPITQSGWSGRKGSPELYTTQSGLVLPDNFARRRLTPEDLYGPDNYGVMGMSDRTRAGARIKALNDTTLDRELRTMGGSDFPYTQPDNSIWASEQGALSGLVNAARKAGATDDSNVFYLNKLMGAQAGDQSYQSLDLATQMLEKAPMTKAQRATFDEQLRPWNYGVAGKTMNMYPDWIGSDKPAAEQLAYLQNRVMAQRSPFMKFLDLKGTQQLGAPDPTGIRLAITDPALFGVPEGTVGRTVGKIDMRNPFGTAPANAHPDYPVHLLGEQMGTMDKPLAPWLAAPDWFEKERKVTPETMTAQDWSSWRTKPVVQRFDQEWLDRTMPIWQQLQGWTPSGLARGGRTAFGSNA